MNYHSRELLVTTKVAQNWHDDFDQQVNVLMDIVSKVDNETTIEQATELMNVYQPHPLNALKKKAKKTRQIHAEKPFEFVVFRN